MLTVAPITCCPSHPSFCAHDAGPLTCQFVFVLDALNFCFWPEVGLEYHHLATGLKAALELDDTALSAENLIAATPATIQQWMPGFSIPQVKAHTISL
jgi:Potential Queuosine, Q, salvage protein family